MKSFKNLWLALLLSFAVLSAPVAVHAADVTITAANVVSGTNSTFLDGTSGATITAGQVVYLDSTTKTFKLADCDTGTAAQAVVVGIALHGASSSQPLKIQTAGSITVGGTLVVGEIYVLSGTAGGIAPKADLAPADRVSVLGVATSASVLLLKPIISGVLVP
jgi:hypothetical protein